MAGPFAASYVSTGRRIIWRTNQSVSRYVVTATVTSWRTPSTSCAYHRGKVSLSPLVTMIAYGSTELSMSTAKSRVNICPERGASRRLPKNGMHAMASTGHVASHARLGNIDAVAALAPATSVASDSHRYVSPIPTQTLYEEKL